MGNNSKKKNVAGDFNIKNEPCEIIMAKDILIKEYGLSGSLKERV